MGRTATGGRPTSGGRPPAGVTVNLRPATYDLQTKLAAVEKVFAKYGDHLHGATPTTEGTGITVDLTAADAKNGPTLKTLADAAGISVMAEISEPGG